MLLRLRFPVFWRGKRRQAHMRTVACDGAKQKYQKDNQNRKNDEKSIQIRHKNLA